MTAPSSHSTSVRALIVQDGKVLLIRRVKRNATYWAIPGGRVDPTDFDEQSALVRECKEELGVDVAIDEFLFSVTIQYPDGNRAQKLYRCHIVGGTVGTGEGPEYADDSSYEGTHIPEWVLVGRLRSLPLFPDAMRQQVLLTIAKTPAGS